MQGYIFPENPILNTQSSDLDEMDDFINVVSNKGIPDDIQEVKVENGKAILDLLVELQFVQSKGEAKRLIQGGGVKIDGEKIADMGYSVDFTDSVVLQAGKRKYAKLVH